MQILKDSNVKCSIFSKPQGSILGCSENGLFQFPEIRAGYHIGGMLNQKRSIAGRSAGRFNEIHVVSISQSRQERRAKTF